MGLPNHLRKHDHWTFLVGFVIVGANIAVNTRYLSGVAFTFLLVALGYDTAEYLGVVDE